MFAFYEQADPAAVSLFIAAASLAVAVPAVPGSVGTYEASIWLALSAFPAYASDRETGIALAVLVHAVNLLLFALTGGLGLLREGVTLRELRESTATTPNTQQPIANSPQP
jgi:glycosyltransferase 2 family protein